jgi:hypothetical protein
MGKKIFFGKSFFTGNKFFFEFFLLVSYVKLWEIYDKKRKEKKVAKIFSYGKKDGEMLIGYTFRVGYTYRADCRVI